MTTNDNELQQAVQRVTTNNNNEWYNEWQRVLKRVINEWQWMTTSGKEWQRVIQRIKTSDNSNSSDSSGTTTKNSTVHFKEWIITVLSMIKTDGLLLQGMDGCD